MIGQVFSAYSEYKDSGIDWLGEIPKHWEVKKLKYVAPISDKKLDKKPDDVTYLGLENIESKTSRLLLDNPIEEVESAVNYFQKGNVLFGKLRPYLAKVAYPEFSGVCTTELLVLNPNHNLFGKYLSYQMLADGFIDLVNSMTYGTKMPRANAEQIQNIEISFPSFSEQKQIATFLDRATTEIDQIIEQQKQLITLLEEERTTVISHAVTKGLDPSVPMKDSGIEWLGEIPKHWDVKPFKHITKRVDVGIAEAATHAYCDEGTPIIRSTNVRSNRLELDDIFCIQEWFAEKNQTKYLYTGDIVTVRTGNAGVSAVIPLSLNKAQCFTLLMSTLQENQVPEFYCFYLNSDLSQVIFSLEGWGTAQVNISVPILKNLFVVEPPFNEQKQIVNYIYQETARIDEAIDNVRSQIEKLEEYHTILISDAVTGKIDVRGFNES